MAADSARDGYKNIQDRIVEILDGQPEPINQKKLLGLLEDAQLREIRKPLKELIDRGDIQSYKRGTSVMYEINPDIKDMVDRSKKLLDDAARAIEKMKQEFQEYPPEMQGAITSSARQLLGLKLDRKPHTMREMFDSTSGGDYDEIRKWIHASIVVKPGHDLLDGEKIVVEASVRTAMMKSLDSGSRLRENLFVAYKEAVEKARKTAGSSRMHHEAADKRKSIEELGTTIARLAERVKQDVSRAIGEAKSAVKKRDGKVMGASPHDDDVCRSEYGMTMDMLDYDAELEDLRGKFELHLRTGYGEKMIPKIEAIRLAMREARECAYGMYAESASGKGSAAYKAAENMRVGVTYCAVALAVLDGRLKEPFSAKDAAKHVECGMLHVLSDYSKGSARLFEENTGRYEIVRKSPSDAADAAWARRPA